MNVLLSVSKIFSPCTWSILRFLCESVISDFILLNILLSILSSRYFGRFMEQEPHLLLAHYCTFLWRLSSLLFWGWQGSQCMWHGSHSSGRQWIQLTKNIRDAFVYYIDATIGSRQGDHWLPLKYVTTRPSWWSWFCQTLDYSSVCMIDYCKSNAR